MIDTPDQPRLRYIPDEEVSLPRAALAVIGVCAVAVADVFLHPHDYYKQAEPAYSQAIDARVGAAANRLLELMRIEPNYKD